MLITQSKKTDYNAKINEIAKKIIDHNHDKYIVTPEFNKLTTENFAEAILPTKSESFTLKDCLSGNVKITKNADPNKYPYLGYGIKFDSCSLFSIPNFDWGENAILFGVDMSSSVHPNNKNKDIAIFGKGQTQGLRKYYTNSRSRIFY